MLFYKSIWISIDFSGRVAVNILSLHVKKHENLLIYVGFLRKFHNFGQNCNFSEYTRQIRTFARYCEKSSRILELKKSARVGTIATVKKNYSS